MSNFERIKEGNREILFRAKRIDNGEWIYGYYAVIGERHTIIKSQSEDYYFVGESVKKSHGNEIIEIKSETVCQYTCLTDKNGRKIFEGDIIKYSDTLHKVIFENRFNTAYFGIVFKEKGEVWDFGHMCSSLDMIVVGNIFDNPELLEQS